MTSPTAPSSPPRSLADQLEGRSLLAALEQLGEKLVVADIPTDVRKILGGLVHLVQTGSIEPPAAPLGREEVRQLNETEAENARLQSQVANLQAQVAQIAADQATAAQAEQAEIETPPAPPAEPTPPADVLPPAASA